MPAKPAKTTRAAQGAVVFPLAAAAAPSLADIAYRRLEEAIVTLRIAPGEVVSEAALSELIGLGRMPTREAVRRLERENLLSVLPKRGILISHIDPVVQLRLLAVRREVERLMVRLAARDASTPERTQFRQLGARFRQAAQTGDSVLFVQSDKTFNELCLSTARNEFVTDAMRLMQGLSRRFWFNHSRRADVLAETARLHAAVAQAIASGDAQGAADACDRLLDSADRFARQATQDGESRTA